MAEPLPIRPNLVVPADELFFSAARASGAGGQNVNKVSSKVELHFNLAASQVLSPAAKQRLRARPGVRFDRLGWLVVTCQESRDQSRNLALARERLKEMIGQALIVPKTRRPTKPTKGSVKRRLLGKTEQAKKKQARARYFED